MGFNITKGKSWKNVGKKIEKSGKSLGKASTWEGAGKSTGNWFKDDVGGKQTGEWFKDAGKKTGNGLKKLVIRRHGRVPATMLKKRGIVLQKELVIV